MKESQEGGPEVQVLVSQKLGSYFQSSGQQEQDPAHHPSGVGQLVSQSWQCLPREDKGALRELMWRRWFGGNQEETKGKAALHQQ